MQHHMERVSYPERRVCLGGRLAALLYQRPECGVVEVINVRYTLFSVGSGFRLP